MRLISAALPRLRTLSRFKLVTPLAVLLLLSVSATTLMTTAAAAENTPIQLRPQWRVGQSATYDFWFQRTRTVTMSFQGNELENAQTYTSEGRCTWVVDKVNTDGSAVCSLRYDWIMATLGLPDESPLTSDSRKASGDNEAIHKLFKAMVDQPLTFHVNADGSIQSVKGTDKIKSRLGKDLEPILPDDLDFIESASELVTLPFVPESLEPGDTYTADFRWTHEMGHTDQQWEYQLVGTENIEGLQLATITGTGKIKLDVDQSEIPKDAPPIDIRMTRGQATSQVFFDLARHEALGRHTTHKETVEFNMTLPQGRGKIKRTFVTESQGQVLRVEED